MSAVYEGAVALPSSLSGPVLALPPPAAPLTSPNTTSPALETL